MAGELLIRTFTNEGQGARAELVEAAELYATTENRLGVILTVACAAMVPGAEPIPDHLTGAARDLVSSLDMRAALADSLVARSPAADGHLP